MEILYDIEEIDKRAIKYLLDAKEKFDNCIDSAGPNAMVAAQYLWDAVIEVKRKGVKIRFITEITKDNLSSCKTMMTISELRHLEGVKGNFGIVDSLHYGGAAEAPPSPWIHSTVKSFIEQQQYFFDMLWRKAIPAKTRIKEIEEGLKREFIETLQDSEEILTLTSKMISSATEEIDIIFSTPNTFKRYESEGIIELLIRKADDGIKVRILLEQNTDIQPTIERLVKMHPQITIKNLDRSVQTKVITILVDNELSLVIELKDDAKQNSNEAIGLTTYSNSESTVLSYVSIFETLWLSPSSILISG
jgi:two-component system, OmpR family, sensor histidine kinase VicK